MSKMKFTDAVEQIRNTVDIVDVVSRHVVLKRSGHNHTGLCPFHKDKKPSFSVNRTKNIYKCFSCGEGGDAFSFLMKIEHKTFGEVIFDLAEEQNIDIERQGHNAEAAAEKKALKQLLLEVNQEASRWFQQQLNTEPAYDVRQYLERRGLSEQTIENFKLGFVPTGWDNLSSHLVKNLSEVQKNPSLLEKSGLASPRKEGGGYYDRFRNRLIIPIHDDNGRVVAFGGRALSDEDQPKYLNSPETELYHKSNVLYGLFQAKDAIKNTGSAIVMEGYFDVISASQGGVTQVVGSCGTALTEQHLKLLARYGAQTVYLAFDADKAGISAALKAITVIEPYLESSELKVKILSIPEGKDPDDYVRTHGGDALKALIPKAKGHLVFQLDNAISNLDVNDTDDRVVGAIRLAPLLLKAVHPVHRQELIQIYASKLKITEDALHLEVNRLMPKRSGNYYNKNRNNNWQSKRNIKKGKKGAIFNSALPLIKRTGVNSNIAEQFSPAALDHLSSLRSMFSNSPWLQAEQDLFALMLCNDTSCQLVYPIVQNLSFQDNNLQNLVQWLQSTESYTSLQHLVKALDVYLDKLVQVDAEQGHALRKVVAHLRYQADAKQNHFQFDAKSVAVQQELIQKLANNYLTVIQNHNHQEQLKSMNNIAPAVNTTSPTELAELELQYQLREQLAKRRQGPNRSGLL